MNDLNKILEDVITVIRQAGNTVMSFYNKDYRVQDKGNDSPITEADLASEKIILEGLKKYDYGILSEETTDDKSRLEKDRVWIIDPLDGTKDFINKTGDFSIMIGLAEKGRPILGAVYTAANDILYYATKNQGAKVLKGNQVGQLRVNDKKKNTRMVSSRFHRSDIEMKVAKKFDSEIITRGSIGVKVCQIACGEAEYNINPSHHPQEYDICAADIILSEAGGKLTDMKGVKYTYNQSDPHIRGYVASNGVLHEKIIGLI